MPLIFKTDCTYRVIRSRLRASSSKFFAKIEYNKTICPEPVSSGHMAKKQTDINRVFSLFYNW